MPSSDAYVRRKMRKQPEGHSGLVLPESLRLAMLETFARLDRRMSVDGRELGTRNVRGHTVETLQAIQGKNPGARVCFIFGGDKLEGLSRWGSYEALASQFGIVVFGRDGADPERTIRSNPALAGHADAFVVLRQPEGIDGISSTAVRDAVERGAAPPDMLTKDICEMLLDHLAGK